MLFTPNNRTESEKADSLSEQSAFLATFYSSNASFSSGKSSFQNSK
ncbi:hypothetical protein D920_01807 [Enterococcus faecalis 13-SD-W-01]|nr:hypothetical protein D920_01807 [Enterococcus faecalis 13-SD-W-01]